MFRPSSSLIDPPPLSASSLRSSIDRLARRPLRGEGLPPPTSWPPYPAPNLDVLARVSSGASISQGFHSTLRVDRSDWAGSRGAFPTTARPATVALHEVSQFYAPRLSRDVCGITAASRRSSLTPEQRHLLYALPAASAPNSRAAHALYSSLVRERQADNTRLFNQLQSEIHARGPSSLERMQKPHETELDCIRALEQIRLPPSKEAALDEVRHAADREDIRAEMARHSLNESLRSLTRSRSEHFGERRGSLRRGSTEDLMRRISVVDALVASSSKK